jgi:hypothetical protein
MTDEIRKQAWPLLLDVHVNTSERVYPERNLSEETYWKRKTFSNLLRVGRLGDGVSKREAA